MHSPLQDNEKVTCGFLVTTTNLKNLQTLCVENFKKAYDAVYGFLASEESRGLRSLSLPRNEWIDIKLLKCLEGRGGREGLTKLNLCNLMTS
jgi:hypothetical protein